MITPTEKYRKLMSSVETTSKPVSTTTSPLYETFPAVVRQPILPVSASDLALLMCRIENELSLIDTFKKIQTWKR